MPRRIVVNHDLNDIFFKAIIEVWIDIRLTIQADEP